MRSVLLLPLLLVPAACSTPYYWTMEKLGLEKRDILVDRVEEGREAQAEAKEQFESALDAFRAVREFDGGDLEEVYERLNSEYESSVSRAAAVSDRIDSIESVADDLFDEWADELDVLDTPELKKQSQALKDKTEARYSEMLGAMRKAESRMDPVLDSFRDHVLFLKHNLNAQAIASLSGELGAVETSIDELIQDMEASIAEADQFLETMG